MHFLFGKLASSFNWALTPVEREFLDWFVVVVVVSLYFVHKKLTINALEVFRIRVLDFLYLWMFHCPFKANCVTWSAVKKQELHSGGGPYFHIYYCPITDCWPPSSHWIFPHPSPYLEVKHLVQSTSTLPVGFNTLKSFVTVTLEIVSEKSNIRLTCKVWKILKR